MEKNTKDMKTLRESLQSSLNESIEGMLQSRADILARNGNSEDEDGYNIIKKSIKNS